MSAPRRISAHDTIGDWLFLPVICLVLVVALVAAMSVLAANPGTWVRLGTRGMGMLILAAGACSLLLIAHLRSEIRLKRVALSDAALLVSNYRREIAVPLGDVESVDQADAGFDPVLVTFADDTAFGRRIEFKPIGFVLEKPHPIIAEIRAAVATARQA